MVRPVVEALRRIVAALLLLTILAGTAVVGSGTAPGQIVVLADDNDGDDEGDDDDGDDGDGDEDGDQGDDRDEDDDEGNDDEDRDQQAERSEDLVTVADPFEVDVSCDRERAGDRTTCVFEVVGPDETVVDLLVPVQGLCAAVTGGEHETVSLGLDEDGPPAYYSASEEESEVELVFDGDVTTSGATVYWVETTGGRRPAAGLGLTCAVDPNPRPESSPSPSPAAAETTGTIVVQAYRCDGAVPPDPLDYDWYGECPAPGVGLALDLSAADQERPVATVRSDDDGEARFPSLDPGTYLLERSGGDWCHAESDSVDAQGRVEVEAGEESTVWIFQCEDDEDVK